MSNKIMNNKEIKTMKPQEEFLRQVIFLKDANKVLAVFPFNHDIADDEYDQVVESFLDIDDADDYEIPEKHEFCLMHEEEFGWGWIHGTMVPHLELATKRDYHNLKTDLLNMRIIKEIFILNEE